MRGSVKYGVGRVRHDALGGFKAVPPEPETLRDRMRSAAATVRFHLPYVAVFFVWSILFGAWRYLAGL